MEGNVRKLFSQIPPRTPKQCTDLSWLLLFCTLWIVLIVIAVFGAIYGNYTAIINGYDSFGNTCGVKDNKPFRNVSASGIDTSNKTMLLFMGNANLSQVVKICVEHCTTDKITTPNSILREYKNTNSQLCRYDFPMKRLENCYDSGFNDRLGPCPQLVADKGFSVKHRCIPLNRDVLQLLETYAFISVGSGPLQSFFTHVYQAWPYMVALIFFAFVAAAAVLLLMRWKPRVTVRGVAYLALVSSLAFSIIEWLIFRRMPTLRANMMNDFSKEDSPLPYHFLADFQINKTAINGLVVLGLLLTEGLFIVLLFTKGDIPRAAVLCEEAIKCWRQVPGLLGLVCGTSVAMVVFFSIWTYTVLLIVTASVKEVLPMGDRADYKNDPNIGLRLFEKVELVEVTYIRNCCWIYVLGFVWVSEFICACQQFCLETAVVRWYFRRPPVACSLIRNHLGSVARGSFLGMLKIPRFLLAYLCKELEKATNSSAASYFGRRLEQLESHSRTHHGMYAIVGIHQIDLYPAGRMASAIMATSAEHVEDLGNSAYFLFFSARLMVANFTRLLGVLLLNNVDGLFFYTAPVAMSAVFAFYIACILLDTIELTLNTLFLCVCEDKRANRAAGRWSQGKLILFSDRSP